MSKITQNMDLEIMIYGMVKISENEHGLAAAQIPGRDPEYWDISVMAYPEGFEENHYVLIEIEDLTQEQLEPCLIMLQTLFPDAVEETV